MEEEKKTETEAEDVNEQSYRLGDLVMVMPRLWPGINKPGGVARITKISFDEEENEWFYSVKYLVQQGTEKRVSEEYISPHSNDTGPRRVKGRCKWCGSFIRDCQHDQEALLDPTKTVAQVEEQERSMKRSQQQLLDKIKKKKSFLKNYEDTLRFIARLSHVPPAPPAVQDRLAESSEDDKIECDDDSDEEFVVSSSSRRRKFFDDSFQEGDEGLPDPAPGAEASQDPLEDSFLLTQPQETPVENPQPPGGLLDLAEAQRQARELHKSIFNVCLLRDDGPALGQKKTLFDGLTVNRRYDALVLGLSFSAQHPQTVFELMQLAHDFTLKMISLSTRYYRLASNLLSLKDQQSSQVAVLSRYFNEALGRAHETEGDRLEPPEHHRLLQVSSLLSFLREEVLSPGAEMGALSSDDSSELFSQVQGLEKAIQLVVQVFHSSEASPALNHSPDRDGNLILRDFFQRFSGVFSSLTSDFYVNFCRKLIRSIRSVYEKIERVGFEVFRRCELLFFSIKKGEFKRFRAQYQLSFTLAELRSVCYEMEGLAMTWPNKLLQLKKMSKELELFLVQEADEEEKDDEPYSEEEEEEEQEEEEEEEEYWSAPEDIRTKRPKVLPVDSSKAIFAYDFTSLDSAVPPSDGPEERDPIPRKLIDQSRAAGESGRIRSSMRKIREGLATYQQPQRSRRLLGRLRNPEGRQVRLEADDEILLVNSVQLSRNLEGIRKVRTSGSAASQGPGITHKVVRGNGRLRAYRVADGPDGFRHSFSLQRRVPQIARYEKSKYYNYVQPVRNSQVFQVEHDRAVFASLNLQLPLSLPTLDSLSLGVPHISTYSSTSTEFPFLNLPHLSLDRLLVDPQLISSYRDNYLDERTIRNFTRLETHPVSEEPTFLDGSDFPVLPPQPQTKTGEETFSHTDWGSLARLWKGVLEFEGDFLLSLLIEPSRDVGTISNHPFVEKIRIQKDANSSRLRVFLDGLLRRSQAETRDSAPLPKFYNQVASALPSASLRALVKELEPSLYGSLIRFTALVLESLAEKILSFLGEILLQLETVNSTMGSEKLWREYRGLELRVCFLLTAYLEILQERFPQELLFLAGSAFFRLAKKEFLQLFQGLISESLGLSCDLGGKGGVPAVEFTYPVHHLETSFSLGQLINWLFDTGLFFDHPFLSDISIRFYARLTTVFLKLSTKHLRLAVSTCPPEKKEIFFRISVLACATFDSLQLEVMSCLGPRCSSFLTTQASWIVSSIPNSSLYSLLWKFHLTSLPHLSSVQLSACKPRLRVLLQLNQLETDLDGLNDHFSTASLYMGQSIGWILLLIMDTISHAEQQRKFTASLLAQAVPSDTTPPPSDAPNTRVLPSQREILKASLFDLSQIVTSKSFWSRVNLFFHSLPLSDSEQFFLNEDANLAIIASKSLSLGSNVPSSDLPTHASFASVDHNTLWTVISICNHSYLSTLELAPNQTPRIPSNWSALGALFSSSLSKEETLSTLYRIINLGSLWETPLEVMELVLSLTRSYMGKISEEVLMSRDSPAAPIHEILTPQSALVHLVVAHHHSSVQLQQTFNHRSSPSYAPHQHHPHYLNHSGFLNRFSGLVENRVENPINLLLSRISVSESLLSSETTRLHHLLLHTLNNSSFGSLVMNKIFDLEVSGEIREGFSSLLEAINLVRSLFKIYFQISLNRDANNVSFTDPLSLSELKGMIKCSKEKILQLFLESSSFESGLLLIFLYKEILLIVLDGEFEDYDEYVPDLLGELIKLQALSEDSLLDMQLRTLLLFLSALFTYTPFAFRTSRVFLGDGLDQFDRTFIFSVESRDYPWLRLLEIQSTHMGAQKTDMLSLNKYIEVIELLVRITEGYVLGGMGLSNDQDSTAFLQFILDLVLSVSISLGHILAYFQTLLIPLIVPPLNIQPSREDMLSFLSQLVSQVFTILPDKLLHTIQMFLALLHKLRLKETSLQSTLTKAYNFQHLITLLTSILNSYLYNYYLSVLVPLSDAVHLCNTRFSASALSSFPDALRVIDWLKSFKDQTSRTFSNLNIENLPPAPVSNTFSLGIDVFGGLYSLVDDDSGFKSLSFSPVERVVYASYYKILSPRIVYKLFGSRRNNIRLRSLYKNLLAIHIPSLANHSNSLAVLLKTCQECHLGGLPVPPNFWSPALLTAQKGYSPAAPVLLGELDLLVDSKKLANINLFSTWNMLRAWDSMMSLLVHFQPPPCPIPSSPSVPLPFYTQFEDSIQGRIVDAIHLLVISAFSVIEQTARDEVVDTDPYDYTYYNHVSLGPNHINNSVSNKTTRIGVVSITRYAFNLFSFLGRRPTLRPSGYSSEWNHISQALVDSFVETYSNYLALMEMELEFEMEIEPKDMTRASLPTDILSLDDLHTDYWGTMSCPAISYKFSLDFMDILLTKTEGLPMSFGILKILRGLFFPHFLRSVYFSHWSRIKSGISTPTLPLVLMINKLFLLPLKKDSEPMFSLDNASSYISNLVRVNFNEIAKVILNLPFAKLALHHAATQAATLKWDSAELDQLTFLLNSIMNLTLGENTSAISEAGSSSLNPFSSFKPFVIIFSLVPNLPFASRITEWETALEPVITILSLLSFYTSLENFYTLQQVNESSGIIRYSSSLSVLRNQIGVLKTNYIKALLSISLSLLHYDSSFSFQFPNFSSFFLSFCDIQLLVSSIALHETLQEVLSCLKYFTVINNSPNFRTSLRARQSDLRVYLLDSNSALWTRVSSNVVKLIQEEASAELSVSVVSIIKQAVGTLPSHLDTVISSLQRQSHQG